MSVSLVRKSLQIVDQHFNPTKTSKNNKNQGLSRESCKIKRKFNNGQKVNLLSVNKKTDSIRSKKLYKSKEDILRANLKKLELIKKASSVDLDKDTIDKIIERGVERRPIKKLKTPKKEQKTAFTEEDFKKFEEEYFDES